MGAPTSAFMLRQGNWKYHYYEGYEPELFNIADDPEEIDDQAANPAVKFVLDRFEEKLRAQCFRRRDFWGVKIACLVDDRRATPDDVAYRRRRMKT